MAKQELGFLCKIPFNNNLLSVLITNNHILNKNDIDHDKIINIMINNEVKKQKQIVQEKNIQILMKIQI